ncbi:uncharacterized protein LOC120631377 [Pararge aegeria]|uniref:Jg7928 protein n=1 Tax=Pararge aegeria aegeria TaxID=348720 RepID=A0A8S4R765_9NEOP|nr:uncharacterized protein LOC120631377 [Pararge aegeria]CAH2230222.1 jg7928 [Pararge aegeria aegeria]
MAVPHITSFCWCFGLEAGTKIIGIFHLIVSLTFMVVCGLAVNDASGHAGTVEDGEDRLYSTWYTITVAVTAVSAVHVVLAATLLTAAFMRKSSALRTWVWLMVGLQGAALLYVLVSMCYGFSASGSDIFLAFVEGLAFYAVLTYCILCVNSYYLLLKSDEHMLAPDYMLEPDKVDY